MREPGYRFVFRQFSAQKRTGRSWRKGACPAEQIDRSRRIWGKAKMKNGKKTYLLIEAILEWCWLWLLMMFRERETGERYRVSVVIPNSEDNQWAAFTVRT